MLCPNYSSQIPERLLPAESAAIEQRRASLQRELGSMDGRLTALGRLAELGVKTVVFSPMGNRPSSGDFASGMTANIDRLEQ